jgi:hypothetical protein
MQAMVFPWFITTYFLTSKYTIFKIPPPKTKTAALISESGG